ncbi:unnamed protein product [Echinostoma caproni]|uniref:BBS2_N domain-containing protein n=1 Tax=Echinostoma caproni TaxID=27848 RepID=A0A183AUE2_9TREM|nr:unnamed protein product [Echinostoma caproni]
MCTSIMAGRLSNPAERDILLLGSQTGVIAYDAYDHFILLLFQMPDGVNAMLISDQLGTRDHPIVVIGGRCSIVALNETGAEVFWTVTGESVMSLTVIESEIPLDTTEEPSNQLVVGSEDYRIRIMQKNAIRQFGQGGGVKADLVRSLSDSRGFLTTSFES